MKKWLALILCLILLACGCRSEDGSTERGLSLVGKTATGKVSVKTSTAQIKKVWENLEGYWTAAEDRFVFFTYKDGKPAFWSGVTNCPLPYGRDPGVVSNLVDMGDGMCILTITYAPVSGDAADELDLKTIKDTVTLDLSGLERDGGIRVKAPEDDWREYGWDRETYEPVENDFLQDDAATADELWDILGGCWVGNGNRFAYFTYADGVPAFLSGEWENPIPYRRDPAVVSSVVDFGNGLYSLGIIYPPVSKDAADSQDLRSLGYTITIDLSGVETNGSLRIEAPEDDWRDYAFGGYSYDDAYDNNYAPSYVTFEEVSGLWDEMQGTWTADNGQYVSFERYGDEMLLFKRGKWGEEPGRSFGIYEKFTCSIGENPLTGVIYYPATGSKDAYRGEYASMYLPFELDMTEMYTKECLHLCFGDSGTWTTYKKGN